MSSERSIEESLARIERRLDDLEALVHTLDLRTSSSDASDQTASPVSLPVTEPVEAAPVDFATPELHIPTQSDMPPTPQDEPARGWAITDVEELITGRLLAWVGGLAIVVGALFFLSMAFSNGWIGPGARVCIGLLASIVAIGAGAWFFERREALFGHVLVAVGLGVVSISLLAATRLYDFVPAEIGLFGALASAIVAAGIAIRAQAQVVAIYGLITALGAPPLLDASPNAVTIGFLAAALAGTVIISLERTWVWLPPVAFVLSAPQAAEWLTDDGAALPRLLVLAGFWTLYALAAGGEEFRKSTSRLRAGSATVLLANAEFLLWSGFAILDGELEGSRGLFLALTAVAHGVLGGYFLYDRQERHPFGLLAFGAAIATLTMAIPVQFGGPPVPLAWAAEATALAWIYGQRRHGYSGLVAVILGGLAIAHLCTVEYPFWDIEQGVQSDIAFVNSSGATLGFVVLAALVSGFLVRSGRLRAVSAAGSLGLVAMAVPFEIETPALIVVAWTLLAAIAFTLADRDRQYAPIHVAAAGLLVGLGVLRTISLIAPPERLVVEASSSIDHPLFLSSSSAALLSIIGALALGTWVRRGQREWTVIALVAAILAVYLLSVGVTDEFQRRVDSPSTLASIQKQAQVSLSILWAVLGGLVFLAGVLRLGAIVRSFGLALLAVASAKVFIYDLASLDATYRVLSFIGLGILLLASSFAYQHFMPLIERQAGTRAPLEETPRT